MRRSGSAGEAAALVRATQHFADGGAASARRRQSAASRADGQRRRVGRRGSWPS